jgi:hypothetical protein
MAPKPSDLGQKGLASGMTIGNVLLRKMIPDLLPLLIGESNHPDIYSGSIPARNFEIGSRTCLKIV